MGLTALFAQPLSQYRVGGYADPSVDHFSAPPSLQFEKRLQSWFTATEQDPRQLSELGKRDYLDMKRREYLRQQQLH